jgi:hypothetical protein
MHQIALYRPKFVLHRHGEDRENNIIYWYVQRLLQVFSNSEIEKLMRDLCDELRATSSES